MNSQTDSPAPDATVRPAEPVSFTGRGSEYFGIWIVNLLLTIATLGVYSAWAKVRRLRYFDRHTQLAGSSCDFHGSPLRILIGRVVALVMLIGYNFTVRERSPFIIVVLLIFAALIPWLLRNSFRFRLYNSSWRGTRFHFRGSVAGSYRVFLLNGFLTLITLYLMAPFMHQRLKAYQHGNSWFGRTRCSFHARVGQFYLIYLMLLLAIAAVVILVSKLGIGAAFVTLIQQRSHGGRPDPRVVLKALAVVYGVLILIALSVGPIFQALFTNLIWNNTRVGEHRIECRLSPLGLAWITVSNFVLIVLTLGFFMPWASVRLARFKLQALRLLPAGDLQSFEAAEPEDLGAVGEEAASLFDFDISL